MVYFIGRDKMKRHFFTSAIFVLLFLAALFMCVTAGVEGKGVHLTVVAPWTETPLLQEGCEFAATRGSSYGGFYKYVHDVWQHLLTLNNTGGALTLTQKSQYEILLHVMESGGLMTNQLRLLAAKIAARAYSPAVEAHWHLARESVKLAGGCALNGDPFVLIAGKAVCDAQRVDEALALATMSTDNTDNATEVSLLFSGLDHIHPGSKGHNVVILYGIVGEKRTMELLHALEHHLDLVRMSFRHLPVIGPMWNRALYVQGYGVKVNLRNVEYKVLDDEDNEEEEDTSGKTSATKNKNQKTHKKSFGGFGVPLLEEQYFEKENHLNDLYSHLKDDKQQEIGETIELASLEARKIGLVLAKHVMDVSDEKRLDTLLEVLTKLSVYSTTLFKNNDIGDESIDTRMLQEMSWIETLLVRGLPSMFLDNCAVDVKDMNIFSLLNKLDNAEKTLESIKRVLTSHTVLFLKGDDLTLSDSNNEMHKIVNSIMEELYRNIEVSALSVRLWISKENIFWLNNLETDPSYANMPEDISSILETSFNNMPIIPRKNLFNVICVIDPTTAIGLKNIAMLLQLKKSSNFFRMGVVFVDSSWSSEAKVFARDMGFSAAPSVSTTTTFIAATMWELLNKKQDLERALLFLNKLVTYLETQAGKITEYNVEKEAKYVLSAAKKRDLQNVLEDPEFLKYYQRTEEMIYSLHFDKIPVTILNGKISYAELLQALYSEFGTELQHLRGLVSSGKLKNGDTNLYDTIMQVSGAKRYYRAYLYQDELYMDWTSAPVLDFLHDRFFILPASYSGKVSFLSGVLVFRPPTTLKVVRAIKIALKQLVDCKGDTQNCGDMRLTYVFCDANAQKVEHRTFIGDLERLLFIINIRSETKKVAAAELVYEFLNKILAVSSNSIHSLDDAGVYENLLSHISFSYELQMLLNTTILSSDVEWQQEKEKQWRLVDGFCAQIKAQSQPFSTMTSGGASSKEIKDNIIHYYVNGRLFLYHEEKGDREHDDFAEGLFVELSLHDLSLAVDVFNALLFDNLGSLNKKAGQEDFEKRFFASKVAALSGLLRKNRVCNRLPNGKLLPLAQGPASFVVQPVNASAGSPRHTLVVLIDPSAPDAQLLASLCYYVTRSQLDVLCTVYLSLTSASNNKPVRYFYQFVADTEVRFDSTGAVLPPAAIFHWLPSDNVLTLAIDEPEGWLVLSLRAAYDLDNIVLSLLPDTSNYLYATYQIKSLLIFGLAKEAGGAFGARGLPLVMRSLVTNTSLAHVTRETVVMDNIGYFQLQGAPGVWYIGVRPGDAAKVFYISKVDNEPVRNVKKRAGESFDPDGYLKNQLVPVVISSFEGRFVDLTVSKTPGNEMKSIENIMQAHPRHVNWPPKGPSTTKPERPTLNIFFVVSGHLYERFLRMAMHSVMQTSSDIHGKNTTLIKFWLIENFLSPKFRTLVPLLAKHYGFEVGFVSYRWPWWLHKQVEKQRTIWAYKILFLDILFPFDVDRIIFIDADQKTFVDMHELYNMDIGDAPMAYTPFCKQYPNKATKSFRFWESGFWFEHLNGKPYHIGALYLADLHRLRAMAGCEKYRALYSFLSKDPNNLANLDQDLPNYIQDEVPIYSLPEEWLWCESWCGSESKARAKTIDLCNNPITKMSKLENAKEVIPEWEEIDAQLGSLSKTLLSENKMAEQAGNETSENGISKEEE